MMDQREAVEDEEFDLACIASEESDLVQIDELESFRQKWKTEVSHKAEKSVVKAANSLEYQSNEKRKVCEARKHFLDGIECERVGSMSNAVKSYRLAIQLDPDIERHMAESQDFDQSSDQEDIKENVFQSSSQLIEKFQSLSLFSADNDKTLVLNTSINILQLPSEILHCIFAWVSSSHIDMKSIESLSETCRKFYLHARDQSLWRLACVKIWGNCVKLNKKEYISWRRMFIDRPHVRLDGVYISRVSYFRQGDHSVFSSCYEPFQCVEYYRYIRFLEDGKMILFTTSDGPTTVIPKLKFENSELSQFRVGKYRSHSEQQKKFRTVVVTGIVFDVKSKPTTYTSHKRATRDEKKYIVSETEYFLDLELTSTSARKRCNKLSWLNYSCQFKYSDGGVSSINEISLNEQFPPFYFSHVNSYQDYSFASL